ncbi:hypothetical protein N8I77_000404 [Diaporthe amygdali]|uniref:Uncharacterized protein n=1 Tax=Phomopsis amygdali TaxID=1214568 RepID=A0AAD9SPX5_PHOAM|nr:hypothetical protein N8I77_000404 [Diaporthe amygdali]
MVKAKDLLPPDPRPSKAHPEMRARRKQLEKEHGYGWVPPVVLGLLGLTLAYDVTKDVEKYENMKHDGEQKGGDDNDGEEARRRRRQRRREELRSRSHRRHGGRGEYDERDSWEGEDGGEDSRRGGSDRGRRERDRDGGLSRADRLEKGEGGPWDRDREQERDRRRGSVYDPADYDEDRYRRRGRDGGDDYYDYERGRRAVEERRGRPRMRRHSSDW